MVSDAIRTGGNKQVDKSSSIMRRDPAYQTTISHKKKFAKTKGHKLKLINKTHYTHILLMHKYCLKYDKYRITKYVTTIKIYVS